VEGASERFVRTVVEPLAGDAEVHAMAQSELAERVAESGGEEAAFEQATRQLEAGEKSGGVERRRRVRRWGVLVMLALAVVLIFPTAGRKLEGVLALRGVGTLLGPGSFGGGPSARQQQIWENWVTRGLSEDERQFLLANDARPVPEDPARYADFLSHRMVGGVLPGDVLERAERIDPGNAHFLLLVAGETADGAVEGKKRPIPAEEQQRAARENRRPQAILSDWEVKDEEAVKEVMELVFQAAEMPRCRSYEGEIMGQRLRLLPEHEDISSGVLRSTFLAAQPSSRFGVMRIGKVMSAEAMRLAEAGDREGFQRLTKAWERLAPVLAEDSQTLIDVLIARGFAQQVGEHLLEGSRTLGLADEERRIEPVVGRLKAIHEGMQKSRGASSEADLRITRHASALAALTLPAISSAGGEVSPPTLEQLEPGRMAEHAMIDQVVAMAMVLLCFVVALATWLFLVMRPAGLQALGERLDLLWGPRDLAWVGLLGLLVPAAGWFLLTHWLPTGGREFGPRLTAFLVPGVQALCLLAAMWTFLLQSVRWRLKKRGGIIGLGEGKLGPGWLMAGLCLGGSALPGLTLLVPAGGFWWLWVSGALALLALVGLTISAVRALFGGHRRGLGRQLAGQVLVPGMALMALMFALLVPLFERQERAWVARDGLMRTDPERPAMTGYEWEVTQAARKELLEALE
jgi:hypothetical protein